MFDDKGDDMSLCHDKKRSLGLTDDFFSNQNTNSFLGIQLHHWDDKKREKTSDAVVFPILNFLCKELFGRDLC